MNLLSFIIILSIQQPATTKTAKGKPLPPKAIYSYQSDILPILASNCSPCHFSGGKVYDEYPFDNYQTVSSLGIKLNTRLKGKEKEVVEQWVRSGKLENSSASK
ncbi:MAG: hypothetical protein HY562_01810 [Ignavibacteriales bacterium]|nr:hypothetical protein [Ignavibacteriales bacterium]